MKTKKQRHTTIINDKMKKKHITSCVKFSFFFEESQNDSVSCLLKKSNFKGIKSKIKGYVFENCTF